MTIHILDSLQNVGHAAAAIVAAQILKKPNSTLGFATGSSPVPTYQTLVAWHKAGVLDFSAVRTFNLDEYVSLGPEHKESYHRFMFDNLFDHINIDPKNVRLPNGLATDLSKECADYDKAIEATGGIDLQILGIGHNGHIGFNEPASTFTMGTNVVDLTPSTIEANLYTFNNDKAAMPTKAITMGIGSIMKARSIIMIITGKSKAPAAMQMLTRDVDPSMPATILQCHSDLAVIMDSEAASLLKF